jgi:hypothetical protein
MAHGLRRELRLELPRARGKTKWPGLAEHVEVRADFGLKSSTQSTIAALAVAGSATI